MTVQTNAFSPAFSTAFDPPANDPAADARDRAIATVRAYCGWHVAPVLSEIITMDGPGTGTVTLPSLRVVSVEAVEEDGITLDPTCYGWSEAGLLRRSPSGWVVWSQPRWTQNFRGLRVALTHGYNDWPADVLGVIDSLASRVQAGPPGNITQVGAVQYATGTDGLPQGMSLTSVDHAVLDPYRLPFRP